VKLIQTSAEKIVKRGMRIENIPLDSTGEPVAAAEFLEPEPAQPRRELLQ
jgi:hypothetical protein